MNTPYKTPRRMMVISTGLFLYMVLFVLSSLSFSGKKSPGVNGNVIIFFSLNDSGATGLIYHNQKLMSNANIPQITARNNIIDGQSGPLRKGL